MKLHFHLLSIFLFIYIVFAQNKFTRNELFASKIYKETARTEGGSFIASPLSAEAVLLFTLFGTRGETARELRKALHIHCDNDETEAIEDLKNISLLFSNKMYINNSFTIKDGFKKIASKIFFAQYENVDFNNNKKAANTINNWVEEESQNQTQNVINAKILSKDTQLILINTLYFKANSSQFLNYYESDVLNARFLELPIEDSQASLTFVLPNNDESLTLLEGHIEKAFNFYNSTVIKSASTIPKLQIETTIDLKKILKILGVHLLFDEQKADLSGISGKRGQLFVSEVLQKSVIEFDRDGFEASGTSYADFIGVTKTNEERSKQFSDIQTFIFFIKVKKYVIFVGRIG